VVSQGRLDYLLPYGSEEEGAETLPTSLGIRLNQLSLWRGGSLAYLVAYHF
jgi:hypothetical protein